MFGEPNLLSPVVASDRGKRSLPVSLFGSVFGQQIPGNHYSRCQRHESADVERPSYLTIDKTRREELGAIDRAADVVEVCHALSDVR